VTTLCADCGRSIVHRPHVPQDLVKLCAYCAAIAIMDSTEEPVIAITEETRREAALYFAKTKGTQ